MLEITNYYSYGAALNKLHLNRKKGIEYKEFHCTRCNVKILVKLEKEKMEFFSVKPTDKLNFQEFLCPICGMQKWPILENLEVIDFY